MFKCSHVKIILQPIDQRSVFITCIYYDLSNTVSVARGKVSE